MNVNLPFVGTINNISAMTTISLLLLIIAVVLLLIILVMVVKSSSKASEKTLTPAFKSTKKHIVDSPYYAKTGHGRRRVLLTKK